ncbi:hypothetical protein [Rhizomonospora bruguierae]|uniref:hypothetical protein n=1 Tax=Rhizomonospora bruguierae TaxID=1581705 RepID=UPI001BCF5085|nr:hypothetical protein [Micromonospora sp. NBRC 107566]
MERPSPEVAADVPAAWTRPVVVVPVFAVLALVGGQLPSFSVAANGYVLVLGGAMVWLGLSGRVRHRPVPGRPGRGARWWLLPAVVLLTAEVVTFALGSTDEYPTLSRLADPLLAMEPVRSACYFAWLSGFWGLVRR